MRYGAGTRWSLLLLVCLPLASGAAQWGVAGEVALLGFGGGAVDTADATDPLAFRPAHARAFALRIDRRFGAWRAGVGVLYATPSLAGEGEAAIVVAKNVFTLLELAPEFGGRVLSTPLGATVYLHAGPVIDFWIVDGDDNRNRWGGQAAVSVEFPLWPRLAGSIRAQGALTPSVFNADDAPPEYERRAQRRLGVSLGLRYRL